MADATLTNKVLILLGNGESSETFAAPCGGNVSTITTTNNTGEAVTLDCTDPLNVVPAIQRWTESQDTSLSISGRLSLEALATWREWADSGEPKNCRAMFDVAAASGGGYWQLPAILQTMTVTRTNAATAEIEATIVAAGRREWTDAS
ncbi:hypothetical protein JI664_12600 [Rhodobacter sp. NTK016B]|uniref:hypothetical protein n=1 Tax=Rhodobacter sp. NTK016B TaxID=2759676 RepID=UPI001A8D78B1|nr:hypothetical protein [Rhodobacter sp. NTK016B]MBN8292806.1 hypothetical protein [Rhodobacter sp. NTK016B]